MKRRNFLSLLGAASLSPALPSFGGGAGVATGAAGYNRFMYGLGVFHVRTRGGLTAAELMARLNLSSAQASAMMSEMTARGVMTGAARVVTQTATPRKPYVRKFLRDLNKVVTETTPDSNAALRRCTGGVQEVHRCHPPADPPSNPTSSGPEKSGVH